MLGLSFLALFSILLFTPHISYSGLEELTILVSNDGTQHLVLGGDIHDREPGTQTERLAKAIAKCQKDDPSTLEVYIERPATLFTLFNDDPRITTDLEPALQKLDTPGVDVKDCETRNVALLAFWLFGKKYPTTSGCILQTGTKECAVNTATFKDLDQEFNELHDSLLQFAQNLSTDVKIKFEAELKIAQNQMNGFRKNIARFLDDSNTIIQAAIKLAEYDREKPWEYERERIRNMALDPASHLFNLNIIRTILSSKATKQLFIAGLLHTQSVKQFLLEANWKLSPHSDAEQQDTNPELIHFTPLLK